MDRHLCTMLHDGVPVFNIKKTSNKMLTDNLTLLENLNRDSPCYKSILQQLATANQDKLRPRSENKEPLLGKARLPLHWQVSKLSVLKTDFDLHQILGGGSYGKVYKGLKLTHNGDKFDVIQFNHHGTPEFTKEFAIKIIPYGEISEATFSLQLVHPNIASCYNVWSDNYNPDCKFHYESSSSVKPLSSASSSGSSVPHPNLDSPNYFKSSKNLVIQQELCTGMTLLNLLQIRDPTPDPETKLTYYKETQSIFAQLLEALVYLEIKDIAHGDLKPDNIILVITNGITVPKILDFGKANYTLPFATDETDHKRSQSAENRRRYISPEQGIVEKSDNLGTLGASHKSNVYSLGLMLIPMLIQFKYNRRTKLISIDANRCIEEASRVEGERKFPKGLNSYPMEFMLTQAMLEHDYRKRPAASEVKKMVKSCQGYKIPPSELHTATSQYITNVDSILNKVIDDCAFTCKYEKVNIDKEIGKQMTKQRGIEKCIGNDLGRYVIQFLHRQLTILKADDNITVDTFRNASKKRLCPAQDLKYLVQLYLDKIEDELTPNHELYREFAIILEEINKAPVNSLKDMKDFIGNIFETGISMQDIVQRLEPNRGVETLEELMSMWSCGHFGRSLTDETHHENREEIEAALINLSTVRTPPSGGTQGIFANIINLITRAHMLNTLNRTAEIDGILNEAFQNLELEEFPEGPEFHSRLLENFGKFLKSFDIKDMIPLVEEMKEIKAIVKNEIGTTNMKNEALKVWNDLGCKCVKCQKKTEDSENQITNEFLRWSRTLIKKNLPFENKGIDELD